MFSNARINGSEENFLCLFEASKEKVYNYCYAITHSHHSAQEIVQEVFLKLWLHRDQLSEIRNHEAYIFAIAKNKVLNHLRKCRYDEMLASQIRDLMIPSSNNVEEFMSLEDSKRLLEKAVNQLPPQRQQVFQLSRNKGLSFEQIAHQLRLSRNTVKNHLVLALRFIRKYIDRSKIVIVLLTSAAFF
jgi:RNA polymerase sigma-70 factor (ECF subfamily)